MPDNSGAFDLGSLSTEDQEAVSRLAEETGAEPGDTKRVKVDTAFVVSIGLEGDVSVLMYDGDNLILDREPTSDLVYGAAAVVQKDAIAQETAQHTLAMQMQQAYAMQQQQREAQIRSGLNL